MPVHTVGLDEGRSSLPKLAALAHAGHSSLLTKHGKPYAAIVAPMCCSRRAANPASWHCAVPAVACGARRSPDISPDCAKNGNKPW